MSASTGYASPHVYNSTYNPAHNSTYGHLTPAYLSLNGHTIQHKTPCESNATWVTAMNRQPVYANLKNIYTNEFRRKATASTQVPGYLQAMGGLSSYTAAAQEYLRNHSRQPYPSYNAGIAHTSCVPMF
jgi:hypothetical protein